jgi:hypothetical protein
VTESMTPVAEHLPSIYEALSSNPSTAQKKNLPVLRFFVWEGGAGFVCLVVLGFKLRASGLLSGCSTTPAGPVLSFEKY